MSLSEEQLEALERTVAEIDALSAIYGESSNGGGDLDEGDSCFSILSKQELETARSILSGEATAELPTLEVEIVASVEINNGHSEKVILCCRIPPGYPDVPVIPTASCNGMAWSMRDELSGQLAQVAESMVGSESIMGLVTELSELCPPFLEQMRLDKGSTTKLEGTSQNNDNSSGYSRLWIWVHHITNTDRRKSIMVEAQSLKLGGFLKHGYPGIIVIEGTSSACDEFATWVKGSKSRPGGFGRNWGHHVRGQVQMEEESQLKLAQNSFQEMEDMAMLGQLCRDNGLEDEFREFAMRHKGGA